MVITKCVDWQRKRQVKMRSWTDTLTDTLTYGLTFCLIAVSFALSYAGTEALALTYGVPYAWAYPFVIEGGAAVSKVVWLRSARHGETDKVAQWGTVAFVILSAVFNVYHVRHLDKFAWLVNGIPPLVMYFAFSLAVDTVIKNAKRHGKLLSLSEIGKEIQQLVEQRTQLVKDIKQLQGKLTPSVRTETPERRTTKKRKVVVNSPKRRQAWAKSQGVGDEAKLREMIVSEFGISDRTARRDVDIVMSNGVVT